MSTDTPSWSEPTEPVLPIVPVEASSATIGPSPNRPEDECLPPMPSADTSPPLTRSETLIDSVVMLLVMSVVQRSVGFVRGILVCRWLSPAELGEWDLAYGFLNLAVPVAVLGIPGSFGRYMERYRMRGQGRRFLAMTGSVICLLAGVGFLAMVIYPAFFSKADLWPCWPRIKCGGWRSGW